MRELTGHKVNGCNEKITISVRDEPGQGGACHHYRMVVDGGRAPKPTIEELEQILAEPNTAVDIRPDGGGCDIAFFQEIFFQNGPIAEKGTNGITNEALLAILEDRLQGFQSGQFACHENELALQHIREAMLILKDRTTKRLARGVEGTNIV